jgi:hypothetical protein
VEVGDGAGDGTGAVPVGGTGVDSTGGVGRVSVVGVGEAVDARASAVGEGDLPGVGDGSSEPPHADRASAVPARMTIGMSHRPDIGGLTAPAPRRGPGLTVVLGVSHAGSSG